MATFDPSQNQNPFADCQKFVVDDQVGGETRFAKFGADSSTWVFRGDRHIFQLSLKLNFDWRGYAEHWRFQRGF